MATKAEERDLLRNLIQDIDIAMFTTLSPEGYPVSRPLSTQKVEFDGEVLWFMTRADSPKIGEVRRNGRVNVAYASPDKNIYVSVTGDAKVTRDQAMINELWSDALKAFFPNGPTDRNLTLVRVSVATAEYWDGPSSAVGKAISFIVARVTKNDEYLGENRLIRLRGKSEGTSVKPGGALKYKSSPTPARPRTPIPAKTATLKNSAGSTRNGASSPKPAARKAVATSKSAARKTPAKKAVAKKTAARKSATARRSGAKQR